MTRKRLTWLLVPVAVAILASLRATVPAGEPVAPPDLKSALRALRAAESYDDEAVGEGGDKSGTYLAYEVLRDRAPSRALVPLTDDGNPIVRCYALRALAEKHADVDVFAILLRHLDDRAEVETFRGCLIAGELVADVMIQDVRPRLTAGQARRLAERVLRSEADLEERRRLLLDDRVPANLLPIVREIARGGDDDALVALARHRKKEDLALLRVRLAAADPARSFRALDAAALYPHPDLAAILEALLPKVRKALLERPPARQRFWFRAVAAQGGDRAVRLLRTVLETPDLPAHRREACAEALFEAIRENRDPAFDPLFRTLWADHGQLDGAVATLLHERDPEWVRDRARADLRADVNRLPEEALGALTRFLLDDDRDGTTALIATALGQADVHRFGVLARIAGRLRDARLVEPLFAAYEGRTNPHSYLAATRALLAYDRADIDARLVAGVKKVPALAKGWGGEALAKLLARKPRGDK